MAVAALLWPAKGTSQALERSQLYGTYTHSTGQPGRTIHREGGEEIHLMPVTYEINTLVLKRFKRCSKSTEGVSYGTTYRFKGRWKIKGDTLILSFQGTQERYIIQQEGPREPIRHLLFQNAPGGFSRNVDD